MSPTVPQHTAHAGALGCPVLTAPAHWRTLDFISDLHLQASQPATFAAWQGFLQTTQADAVFILGDLFEVWVGDDIIDQHAGAGQTGSELDPFAGFEARCAQVLKAASQRLDLFFMAGNRDFLLGPAFAKACGLTLLADPCALDFAGQRWLLSHGDALCLQDTNYLQFRAQVRSELWQQNFLLRPLSERLAIARQLRVQSESHKNTGAMVADVDSSATCDWLQDALATTLIHGHTHRPANHELGGGLSRIVLSDWDASATPPRAEVLRLHLIQEQRQTNVVTTERLPLSAVMAEAPLGDPTYIATSSIWAGFKNCSA